MKTFGQWVLGVLLAALIIWGLKWMDADTARMVKEACHADLILLHTPQDSISYLRRHECRP